MSQIVRFDDSQILYDAHLRLPYAAAEVVCYRLATTLFAVGHAVERFGRRTQYHHTVGDSTGWELISLLRLANKRHERSRRALAFDNVIDAVFWLSRKFSRAGCRFALVTRRCWSRGLVLRPLTSDEAAFVETYHWNVFQSTLGHDGTEP